MDTSDLPDIGTADSVETLCQLCEQPSRDKPLCYSCYTLVKDGTISPCDECGDWKNDAKPLCRRCWGKQRKAKRTGKKVASTLPGDRRDRFGSPKHRTKSGLKVRSLPEMLIADYLYDMNVRFRYEPTLILKEFDLNPDFYIEDAKVYLEYSGMSTARYLATLKRKEAIYREHKITVVFLKKEHLSDLETNLRRKLVPYLDSLRGQETAP
ncbi:hypothetical protein IIA16_01595 [bacterium]|nr:hypothetical protein [bacterium]